MVRARIGVLTVIVLGTIMMGCSGIRVTTDYDPLTDFSGYRTYAWLPEPPERSGDYRVDNAIVSKRITNAVERQLQAAGFVPSDLESASFLIAYHVALTERIDITAYDNFYGYYGSYWGGYPGYYGGLGGVYSPDVYVRYYDEGTVVLDIIDPKTRNLVWRGSAQSRVDDSDTPEERDARVNEAYRRILERFPPGKMQK